MEEEAEVLGKEMAMASDGACWGDVGGMED
jgi:hypothetical protein